MSQAISLFINRKAVTVTTDMSVAAAIALHAGNITRISVTQQSRAPVCGMGICQECRVTINGQPHQLACQTLCEAGMDIFTGHLA